MESDHQVKTSNKTNAVSHVLRRVLVLAASVQTRSIRQFEFPFTSLMRRPDVNESCFVLLSPRTSAACADLSSPVAAPPSWVFRRSNGPALRDGAEDAVGVRSPRFACRSGGARAVGPMRIEMGAVLGFRPPSADSTQALEARPFRSSGKIQVAPQVLGTARPMFSGKLFHACIAWLRVLPRKKGMEI